MMALVSNLNLLNKYENINKTKLLDYFLIFFIILTGLSCKNSPNADNQNDKISSSTVNTQPLSKKVCDEQSAQNALVNYLIKSKIIRFIGQVSFKNTIKIN